MSLPAEPCHDPAEWDQLVDATGGHPMQLWGWGELKAAHRWRTDRVVVRDGSQVVGTAQVLLRRLPPPLTSLAYLPRGPQCEPGREGEVLQAVGEYVRRTHHSVVLSVEPDWESGADQPDWPVSLQHNGFRQSQNTVLIARTLILDLHVPAEELMAAMTSTTRQNIRKAAKSGLDMRRVDTDAELEMVLAVYRETAERAGFALHEPAYYRDVFDLLGPHSWLVAAFDGPDPVAFVWLAVSRRTAFELYGGVNQAGQKKRINYGLKWHAITLCQQAGVERYDMNGLLNDGISEFKKQFAKHENRLVGAWDLPLSRWYPAYAKGLPFARDGLRRARGLAHEASRALRELHLPGRAR